MLKTKHPWLSQKILPFLKGIGLIFKFKINNQLKQNYLHTILELGIAEYLRYSEAQVSDIYCTFKQNSAAVSELVYYINAINRLRKGECLNFYISNQNLITFNLFLSKPVTNYLIYNSYETFINDLLYSLRKTSPKN